LDHARLLGLAPNRWDEVKNTFKCRYVSHHNRHVYGAEGKVYIFPTPKKRLKMLVPPPLQKQSVSSTAANVQPNIENSATSYIGRACKKKTSNDVDDNTPLMDTTLRSSWGTPRVTRRDAAGVFLATPFHAGVVDLDDNCKIDSLMPMLADAKLRKEVEFIHLRTRSTNKKGRAKVTNSDTVRSTDKRASFTRPPRRRERETG
jgi:hypothetical protein